MIFYVRGSKYAELDYIKRWNIFKTQLKLNCKKKVAIARIWSIIWSTDFWGGISSLRTDIPCTSPVGPLQRTALRKKLINQLLCFHSLVSASKLAPQATKTKGVESSTPFCFVCSLRRGRDSNISSAARSTTPAPLLVLPFVISECKYINNFYSEQFQPVFFLIYPQK